MISKMKILIAGFVFLGKAMEALRGYNFKGLGWSALLWEDDVISSFSNWKMKTCQISQMMVWEMSLRGDVQRLASFCWGGS